MSIQSLSPLSKSQSPEVLERRMQGLTLYLAWGMYIILWLVIGGLTIRGIQESIEIVKAERGFAIYNLARVILIYPVGFGIISLFLILGRPNDRLVFTAALALLLYGGATGYLEEGAKSIGLLPLSIFLVLASNIVTIRLFLTFPNGVFVPSWTRIYFRFVLLLGLVTFSRWTFREYIPWLPQTYTGPDFLDWIWQLVTAVGIYAQLHRFKYVSSPIEQQQVKWILTILPISFLLTISHLLVRNIYLDVPNPSETLAIINEIWKSFISLADLAVAITAALAVYRYKLWETDFYLIRTLVFGTVTAVLAGLWWFGAILVQFILNRSIEQQSSPLVVAILSGLPAAALFQPLSDSTKKWVETRIYKDQIDLTQVVVELRPENWQFVSLPDMFRAVMKNTARLLEIDRAAIYTLEGESMRLMESMGIPPDQASQFYEINISEMQKGKTIQLGGEKTFTMLVPLVVPRGRTNDLVGVLALGPRAQSREYSRDHISNLKHLGERAGTAIYFLQLKEKKNILVINPTSKP